MLVFNLLYLFAARPFPPQEQTFLPLVLVSPANVCLIYQRETKKLFHFLFSILNILKSEIPVFLLFLFLCRFLKFLSVLQMFVSFITSKRNQEIILLSLFEILHYLDYIVFPLSLIWQNFNVFQLSYERETNKLTVTFSIVNSQIPYFF